MVGKPDVFILHGVSGKKAYEDICNAKPLSKPQYSSKEREEFNREFSKIIPEIIANWNAVEKTETAK